MATKAKSKITKKDIDDCRALFKVMSTYDTLTKRLTRSLGCDFIDIYDAVEIIAALKPETDDEIAFAIGRLTAN